MFEKATRQKLRFPTVNGDITVEDLWDLPLKTTSENRASLNNVAITINRALKDAQDDQDFITGQVKTDSTNELRMEIIRRVIEVKLEDNARAKATADKRERNQRIREILEQKDDQKLLGKSRKALEAMLEED